MDYRLKLVLFLFLSFFNLGFSSDMVEITSIDNQFEENLEISYVLDYRENLEYGDKLLILIDNGGILDNKKLCEVDIEFDSSVIFKKDICLVDAVDSGEYEFITRILRDNDVIFESVTLKTFYKSNFEFISGDAKFNTSYDFFQDENGLHISLSVDSVGENLIVYSQIPKEALELVTEETKDDLIETDFDFEIIEEDPLIAWNVEMAPTKINYTIKKDVDPKTYEDFKINVEQSKTFSIIKLIVSIAFIILLLFVFKIDLFKRFKRRNE